MSEEINDIIEDVIPVPELPKIEDGQEDTTDYKALATQQREIAEKNRGIAQRNKTRAERFKLAGIKPEVKPEIKPEVKTNDSQFSDELKLIARGLSDEAIEQAKVIAKGKGISLTEAIKDPTFLIIQKDLDEKERKEKAKLGASKGSGESEEQVSGLQSGSSREEHEKAFKKLVSKK